MKLIDPADTAAIRIQIDTLRSWRRDDLRVALVYGGISTEDQLYLAKSPVEQLSSTALTRTLAGLGLRHQVLDPCDPGFVRALGGFDVVLSNLHGPYGEDGRLQGLLDYLRVRYCGSSVGACAVAADKVGCKRVMESLGVPTPSWQVWAGEPLPWPGYPVMVKPSLGGSSVGMSLVRTPGELARALGEARVDGSAVLIEKHIPGLPVTVGLLELPGGVLAFPPLATRVHGSDWYDADAKLDAETQGLVTVERADLPLPVVDTLIGHARTLWQALGCRGMARVDFMVTEGGEVYALEVNTTPGLSAGSNFAVGAGLTGLDHGDVVRAILHEAMTRQTYDVPLPTPRLADAPDRPGGITA